MKSHQIKAFTLVELIIVITILAILATIGFMSFQSYTADARDANRVTSIKEATKGLEIYQIKNRILPMPDEALLTITSASGTISYQGYLGATVQKQIRLTSEIKDSKDNNYYTYSINSTKTKYQLLTMLESEENLAINKNIVKKTYARIDYTNRYPYTAGDKVGIIFSGMTNTPYQETLTNSTGTLALSGMTNTQIKVIFSNSKTNSGTIIATGSSLPSIIETETTSLPTTQTQTYSCASQPTYTNANFTIGTPTSVNQARQNTNSANPCYYSCTGGYSGIDCTSKLAMLDFFGDNSGKALYRFEDNSNDTSGNYNGTAYNITYSAGKFGNRGNFNGTNTYIKTSFLAPSTQNYSYSVWIKTSNSTNNMGIFEDFDSLGQNKNGRRLLGFRTSKYYFNMGNGTSSWYNETGYDSSAARNGNWHNLVIVVNGTSQKLYLDGTEIVSLTSTITGTIGTIGYSIGRLGDYNGGYFNGQIDQLRIFTKSLSPSEVNQIYNET